MAVFIAGLCRLSTPCSFQRNRVQIFSGMRCNFQTDSTADFKRIFQLNTNRHDPQLPHIKIWEQERIVTILDKFDALVNDISIGLPAELSARRQQYEYYRGKLLTFNEVKSG